MSTFLLLFSTTSILPFSSSYRSSQHDSKAPLAFAFAKTLVKKSRLIPVMALSKIRIFLQQKHLKGLLDCYLIKAIFGEMRYSFLMVAISSPKGLQRFCSESQRGKKLFCSFLRLLPFSSPKDLVVPFFCRGCTPQPPAASTVKQQPQLNSYESIIFFSFSLFPVLPLEAGRITIRQQVSTASFSQKRHEKLEMFHIVCLF